ncbi:MAG: pilt protein domain protein [Phycisphaerales bacterium]|nr:pilt protein domain protein [Phycisphaerales bacterium]
MTSPADRPRVVFDCNVLIQAIANDAGPSGTALRHLQRNLIEVFVSRPILKELRAVLNYPKVRQKLPGLQDDRIEVFIQQLLFRATFLREVPHIFNYPRAKQDEPYVDLAAVARADCLVSRDRDLLSLMTDHSVAGKQFRQRCPRLRVLSPVEFLASVPAPPS